MLFRGYLPTNKKRPTMKFDKALSLEEVGRYDEYAGILANDVILVDIDNHEQSEKLFEIIKREKINCRVSRTARGLHFFFRGGNIDGCGTHVNLAIGVEADIKVGSHNSIAILKWEGVVREVLYDVEPYDKVPEWLRPVKSKIPNFFELDTGRNQTFFNYILTLQKAELATEDIKSTIRLINKYVISDPLDEGELTKILRDESFKKPVFNDSNGKFLFDKFARFLKNECNVIKLDGQLHMYQDGVYIEGSKILEKEMIKHISGLSSRNRTEILKYLELIAPEMNTTSNANYIAFNNGIYNLETEQLENFNPSIVIKNRIPHNYNNMVYNETMDNTLNKLSCGDKEIRALLEEMAGYTMYRRNELRKAFILIGDKANGKSTYLDCIAEMLGKNNTSALDLNELDERFKTAELFGKLVNIGDDIGDEFIPNAAIFKKLVSGDRVSVERKGKDPFDFNNYSKLLFSANTLPRIKDRTGAVLDRLILIPFNATFRNTDSDYDPDIKYKLRSEQAIEYLIYISLKALKRVVDNKKFTITEKVQAELDEYNEENNPIIGFINELDIDVDIINEPINDVYLQYKLYCEETGHGTMSRTQFTKAMKKELKLDIGVGKNKDRKSIKIFRRK